jgi:peptide/nickel transport system permease protein
MPGGARAGALILLLFAALGAAAPLLAPYPPDSVDLPHRLDPPGLAHPLGCDDLGRDVLSRLLHGARVSLGAGLAVTLIAGTVGLLLGALAGHAGGRIDAALVGLIDLLLGFPGVLLAIAIVAVVGPRLTNLIVALCLIGWVGYARLARSLAIRLREAEFVQAAGAAGASRARIIGLHLLPALAGPILVQAALGLGGVIVAEAGLSFLGLGVPPPTASWGSMLRAGSQNLLDAPHLTIVPALAIFGAILGANLLADGLGGGIEPRRRETAGTSF